MEWVGGGETRQVGSLPGGVGKGGGVTRQVGSLFGGVDKGVE